jgi:hypothetical protein
MTRSLHRFCQIFVLYAGVSHSQNLPQNIQPVLAKNCLGCHNAKVTSGAINLQPLLKNPSVSANADAWERILTKLRSGEMPPPNSIVMPQADRARVIQDLDTAFSRLDQASPAPDHVTIRRLNRTEYNNTVRDLLGVDFRPAADFPPDDSGYGFDNIGEVLSMSPSLTEKYVKAAERIARTAIYGPAKQKPALVSLQPWYVDFGNSKEVLTDYDQTGMSLPSALHATHYFPVDAEYEIAGLLRGTRPNGSEDIPVAFWIDGKQVQVIPYPVPPGGEVSGQRRQFRIRVSAGEHWLSASVLRLYEGLPPVYAGPNPSKKPQTATPRRNNNLPSQATTAFFVSNLDITGPFDQSTGPSPESRQKIYACTQRTAACEKQILTSLARRAYRRPPTQAELNELMRFARMARDGGDTFEEGLVLAIQKMLISPAFLFRVEQPAKTPLGRLSDHELATRLSYFLWSTMPDEHLQRLATSGKLRQPAILRAQVQRMLADKRVSDGLVENFASQWLQFRGLESHDPDRRKFQQFTEYTRMSLSKETALFFENLIREDRSILDLIDGRYSFLNERLGKYYGIPGIRGHEFRKVDLSGSTRAGILTHGSVLTVSSYANRTSPVLRGKWILENLLNAAPPPAPPDIPNLDEDAVGSKGSLRQQMEQHRSNPACASCHARMDPLGYGLENFDAIGQWRTKDGSFPIDSSGELPGGRRFSGPVELASILRQDSPAFTAAMADKLLTYALGRGLSRRDRNEVRQIAKDVAADGHRFSSLVQRIVSSKAFQFKGQDLLSKGNTP